MVRERLRRGDGQISEGFVHIELCHVIGNADRKRRVEHFVVLHPLVEDLEPSQHEGGSIQRVRPSLSERHAIFWRRAKGIERVAVVQVRVESLCLVAR